MITSKPASEEYRDNFDRVFRREEDAGVMSDLRRLQEKLVARGVRRISFTWAPGAEKLTVEQRAADVLKMLDALERGAYEVVFDTRNEPPSDIGGSL